MADELTLSEQITEVLLAANFNDHQNSSAAHVHGGTFDVAQGAGVTIGTAWDDATSEERALLLSKFTDALRDAGFVVDHRGRYLYVMTDELDERIADLRARHRMTQTGLTGDAICKSDKHSWPCHADRALAALEALVRVAHGQMVQSVALRKRAATDPDVTGDAVAAFELTAATLRIDAVQIRKHITSELLRA